MPTTPARTTPRPRDYFADPEDFGRQPNAALVMPVGGDPVSQLRADGQNVLVCRLNKKQGRKLYSQIELHHGIARSTFNDVRRGSAWIDLPTWAAATLVLDAGR